MMKNTILLLLLMFGVFACKDDDKIGFDVPVEFRKDLSFRPVPGGAIMNYYLPRNTDVFGVRVRYANAWGEQMSKDGTYLTDSLVLRGFTEARQDVSARVSFFNNNMVESEPIEVKFNTENSATVAIFDSLEVNPFWGGFNITYRSPETVSGMLHVFYLGTNPLTNEPDSILMASTPIAEGGDTLNFVMQQAMETTDVIVRTDDFNGKRVKQQIFVGLPCLSMDTLKPDEFDFKYTGKVFENKEYELSLNYLFDGDKKGTKYRKNRMNGKQYKYSTFVTDAYAFGERFIIDLREEKIPASVSLYAFLNYQTSWPFGGHSSVVEFPEFLVEIWNASYCSRLPAKMKLYGTNSNPETVDLNSCVCLFKLDDDPDFRAGFKESWATRTAEYYGKGGREDWMAATDTEVEAAEPVCLKMLCDYTGARYRYLIFVVEDTYDGYGEWGMGEEQNPREYVTFNELEVCVKAE